MGIDKFKEYLKSKAKHTALTAVAGAIVLSGVAGLTGCDNSNTMTDEKNQTLEVSSMTTVKKNPNSNTQLPFTHGKVDGFKLIEVEKDDNWDYAETTFVNNIVWYVTRYYKYEEITSEQKNSHESADINNEHTIELTQN